MDYWERYWNRLSWSDKPVSLDSVAPEQADAYSHVTNLTNEKQERFSEQYQGRERRISEIVRTYRANPSSALDVGAGAGHWSEFCHREWGISYSEITALDISETALSYVRKRCPGINTVVGNLGESKGLSGHFDIALAIGVLHHVTTREGLKAAIDEILSVADFLVIYPVHVPPWSVRVYKSRKKASHYKRFWTYLDYRKVCHCRLHAWNYLTVSKRS